MSKDIRREGSTQKLSNYLMRLRRCASAFVMLAAGLILAAGARAESFRPADGFQPKPGAVEIPAKRTQSSKTFANPDGTRTWSAMAGSVHYVDRAGKWNEIDESIRPLSDDERRQSMLPAEDAGALDEALQSLNDPARGLRDTHFSLLTSHFSLRDSQLAHAACPFAYGMTKNAYHSYFAADASGPVLVKFATGRWSVSFGIEGGQQGSVSISGNTITYHNALGDADLRFTTNADRFMTEVILHSKPTRPIWRLPVAMQGVHFEHNALGTLDFVDGQTGQRVWYMPKPFMTDAAGRESAAVRKTVVANQSGLTFVVSADETWLSATDRAYPVVVDPTWGPFTPSKDCWGEQAAPTTNRNVQLSTKGVTNNEGRAFVAWDMTTAPTQAQTISAANSVRIRLYRYSSGGTPRSVGMCLVSSGTTWSETTMTWNTMPTSYSAVLAALTPANAAYSTWAYNGNTSGLPSSTLGVVFKTSTINLTEATVNYHSKNFPTSSSNKPDINIDYTADTTPPSVTINQASGQADPATTSPINFTVVFSESVTGFATGDVNFSGTAGGTLTGTVTGSGTTYNVAVTGMNANGTVIAAIPAGVATDASGNGNTASTSTDNTVTWSGTCTTPNPPTAGTATPNSTTQITWGWTRASGASSEVYRGYDGTPTLKWTSDSEKASYVESDLSGANVLYGTGASTANQRQVATYTCAESTKLALPAKYTLQMAPSAVTYSSYLTDGTGFTINTTGPANLGSTAKVTFNNVGTDRTPAAALDELLTGLTPNTQYTFKAKASNTDNVFAGIADHTGTYTGTITKSVANKWGSGDTAISMAANTGNYINIGGASNNFADFTGGITIELWANPTSVAGCAFASLCATSGSSTDVIDLITNSGTPGLLQCNYRNNTTQNAVYTNTAVVTTGSWQHLAVTIDAAGTCRLYRNGVEQTNVTRSLPTLTLRNVTRQVNGIGHTFSNLAFTYAGSMDDVAIYDYALGSTRLSSHYGAASATAYNAAVRADSPIAYWRLGEAAGTTAYGSHYYSEPTSTYTYSVSPDATAITPSVSSPCPNTSVTWTPQAGHTFGAGGVEYYRYVFDQTATHTWTDTETQWSSGTIDTTPTSAGTWYLHVKGYNGDDVGNGAADISISVTDVPGAPVAGNASGVTTDSITWNWSAGSPAGTSYSLWTAGSGGALIDVGATGIAGTSYAYNNLDPGTPYTALVQADSGCGSSATRTELKNAAGAVAAQLTAERICPENGDFEDWAVTTIADHWVKAPGGDGTQSYGRSTVHREGTYSQAITDPLGGQSFTPSLYQKYNVTPGGHYIVSIYNMRTTGSGAGCVVHLGVDVNGGTTETVGGDSSGSIDTWVKKEVSFTAGAGGLVTVLIKAGYNDGSGTAYIDGVYLAPQAPTTSGGTATICEGASTDVTASGGYGGSSSELKWYTGADGTGTLVGTGSPLSVSPSSTTTYHPRWELSGATSTCLPSDDGPSVTVTIVQPPTTATVGSDQTICALGTTTGLGGNATGTWSVVSGGTGTFTPDDTTPNATFTHTGGLGPVLLRWTISGTPPCSDSTADVTITITQPPTTATVGSDQTICALGTTAGLSGNDTGTWSVVSGGTGTFDPDDTTPNATFTHTGGAGPVVVRWTIVGTPPCSDSTADVTITITSSPSASLAVSPSSTSISSGSTVAVTISSSETGVTYQLYDVNASANSGSSGAGNGGDLVLTSDALTASTTLQVKATRSPCTTVTLTNEVAVTVTGGSTVDLLVTIRLLGLHAPDEFTPLVLHRNLTFELYDCTNDTTTTVDQVLTFTSNDPGDTYAVVTGATVQAPIGTYSCVTVRDKLHTLRRKLTLTGSGPYTVDMSSQPLIGGNMNDDEYVDILDFAGYAVEYSHNYGTGDTTNSTPSPNADISGNGVVGTEDFTFVNINFLSIGEAACSCPARPASKSVATGPRRSVPVTELKSTNKAGLAIADLNGDGVVDSKDVALWIQGARPGKPLPTAPKRTR